jgi:hypothetical protein
MYVPGPPLNSPSFPANSAAFFGPKGRCYSRFYCTRTFRTQTQICGRKKKKRLKKAKFALNIIVLFFFHRYFESLAQCMPEYTHLLITHADLLQQFKGLFAERKENQQYN